MNGEGRAEEEGHCTLKRPTCIQGHRGGERENVQIWVFFFCYKKEEHG